MIIIITILSQRKPMTMTPLDYYRERCDSGLITSDEQQLVALAELQRIHHALIGAYSKRLRFLKWPRKPQLVHGLYLWGGVGIGKTFLMDCLYHCLPFQEKMRMHFHQFMRMVHKELKKHQGQKNPLQVIAKELAQQTRILCFDEFFVTDITDAMILARLLKALFAEGVCLVTTSNTMPDDLYKRGLQRELFLPAIALIKENTNVLHLPTTIDYRLRHLKTAGVFYTPNDQLADMKMEKTFAVLTNGEPVSTDPIEICGRSIQIKKQAGRVVWLDFGMICSVPRSQHDYLAIAEQYQTVFISHIPIIPPQAKNQISLLVRLIDVFYDAHIRLVCSAASAIENLYSHGPLLSDYKRTRSRLLEMQSEKYFSIVVDK